MTLNGAFISTVLRKYGAPLTGVYEKLRPGEQGLFIQIYPRKSSPEKLRYDIAVAAHFDGRVDSSSFNRYSSEALLLLHTEASNEPLMLCQILNRAPGKAAVAEKN